MKLIDIALTFLITLLIIVTTAAISEVSNDFPKLLFLAIILAGAQTFQKFFTK